MTSNLSIHPRHWPVSGTGEKKNTSSESKGGKHKRKAQEKLGRRRLAHASTIKSLSQGKQNAYRTPGSMRLDKQG